MFRLQDNVPQNYVSQSRDFQLFCRLYDYINSGVKFDIDSMLSILDPMKVKNNILKLLAIRFGFFPTRELDDTMMRYIVSTFPLVTKLKGTRKGICACIDTILNARNVSTTYSVVIDNEDYTIDIAIKGEFDRIALEEYLRYIIPPGYITTTSIAQAFESTTQIDQISIVHAYVDTNASVSQVTDDYSNYHALTYSIKIEESEIDVDSITGKKKPLYYTSAGTPDINIDDSDESKTTTVFTYFEKVENSSLYYKKTLTMVLPKQTNIQSRRVGDISRAEVIGSINDGSYVSQITAGSSGNDDESSFVVTNGNRHLYLNDGGSIVDDAGKYVSDDINNNGRYNNEKIATHLTYVFTDLLEQENNNTLVLRVKNKKLYTFPFDTIDKDGATVTNPGSVLREPSSVWSSIDTSTYPTDFSEVVSNTEEIYLFGSVIESSVIIPEGITDIEFKNYTKYLIDDYGTVAQVITPENELENTANAYFFQLAKSNLGNPPIIAEKHEES